MKGVIVNKEKLIEIYASGIYMLSLLEEWSALERLGKSAEIYNTITKKHNFFFKQIDEYNKKKRKKISEKCTLFIKASSLANTAWKETAKNTKSITISANTTIHNLYRLNSEDFTRIYGLNEDDFRILDSKNQHNSILNSCKMARLLLENTRKHAAQECLYDNIYLTKGKTNG